MRGAGPTSRRRHPAKWSVGAYPTLATIEKDLLARSIRELRTGPRDDHKVTAVRLEELSRV